MRIVVHVNGYYDWDPLPKDAEVTEADVKAKKVKPDLNGAWLMRVNKKGETHTTVLLPEGEIITLILQDSIKDQQAHTRSEALGHYLARHTMPHHAHRSWMKGFEIDDDGPNPELFEKMLDEQIAAGNIVDLEKPRLLEAYMKPLTTEHHVEHLHSRFGVEKKGTAKKGELST